MRCSTHLDPRRQQDASLTEVVAEHLPKVPEDTFGISCHSLLITLIIRVLD